MTFAWRVLLSVWCGWRRGCGGDFRLARGFRDSVLAFQGQVQRLEFFLCVDAGGGVFARFAEGAQERGARFFPHSECAVDASGGESCLCHLEDGFAGPGAEFSGESGGLQAFEVGELDVVPEGAEGAYGVRVVGGEEFGVAEGPVVPVEGFGLAVLDLCVECGELLPFGAVAHAFFPGEVAEGEGVCFRGVEEVFGGHSECFDGDVSGGHVAQGEFHEELGAVAFCDELSGDVDEGACDAGVAGASYGDGQCAFRVFLRDAHFSGGFEDLYFVAGPDGDGVGEQGQEHSGFSCGHQGDVVGARWECAQRDADFAGGGVAAADAVLVDEQVDVAQFVASVDAEQELFVVRFCGGAEGGSCGEGADLAGHQFGRFAEIVECDHADAPEVLSEVRGFYEEESEGFSGCEVSLFYEPVSVEEVEGSDDEIRPVGDGRGFEQDVFAGGDEHRAVALCDHDVPVREGVCRRAGGFDFRWRGDRGLLAACVGGGEQGEAERACCEVFAVYPDHGVVPDSGCLTFRCAGDV